MASWINPNNHWLSRKALKAMTDTELDYYANHGGVDCSRAERERRRRKAKASAGY